MTDPCHGLDTFVEDIIDLRAWTPSDRIEQVSSSELGVWKPPCVHAKWWAPVFAMTFVVHDEGMAFETFGVN